jgi:hypothetical protein
MDNNVNHGNTGVNHKLIFSTGMSGTLFFLIGATVMFETHPPKTLMIGAIPDP